MICSEGQELLLKDNEMIYNGLAMIDGAKEELSELYSDKSLHNHPEVQILEEYISKTLKKVHFKDKNDGHIAHCFSLNTKTQFQRGFSQFMISKNNILREKVPKVLYKA